MSISPSYPNNLQNGTTADATQVMANFNQIQNDVNANAAQNGANSDITSLTGLTTPLGGAYGGTGVANTGLTLTMGGNVTFSGAFTFTGTITGNTSVTFPTSGTLLNTSTAASTYAPLASPTLTGTPLAPTATAGTSTTQIATTAFVNSTALTITNGSTCTTQSANDNSTKICSTAYADRAATNAAATVVAPKAWGYIASNGTVTKGNNVASVTHNGTGDYTINFSSALSDGNYAVMLSTVASGTVSGSNGSLIYVRADQKKDTSGFRINVFLTGVLTDTAFSFVVFD